MRAHTCEGDAPGGRQGGRDPRGFMHEPAALTPSSQIRRSGPDLALGPGSEGVVAAQPPTAEHVEAVHRALPPQYKVPLLVLDATAMRLGELEQLTWGDVDEQRGRWRVSAAVSK